MEQVSLLPRASLVWLMLAQALAVAPHLLRLPWVLGLLCIACLGWRLGIHRGWVDYPRRMARWLLAGVGMVAIAQSFPGGISLDPAVALLVVASQLKLLEMKSQRDVLLVIVLGYFVAATQCLFSQTLPSALYALLCAVASTAALVAAQGGINGTVGAAGRRALVMLLQSLPLMLVLFLVFPRLGPLWSVPLPGPAGAQTGIGDSLSPGDFGELILSDELAFRATFDGDSPPRADLYWRGPAFELFDGRRWQPVPEPATLPILPATVGDDAADWRYSIMLEPTRQRWLFALAWPRAAEPVLQRAPDEGLRAKKPVTQRMHYRVASGGLPRVTLTDAQRALNLALGEGNPRARALGEQLRARFGTGSDPIVAALLMHFRAEPFSYTLRPPVLGENPVDAFLFESRQGFCEHYASAMAFVLRSAGIPARVVLGYQGGEFDAERGYWRIRQSDAHAWVEYWREGEGWQRVDPTGAIAPERIQRGVDEYLRAAWGSGLLSPHGWRFNPALAWVAEQWEAANYAWLVQVVGYQGDRQRQWLKDWLGGVDAWRIGTVLLGAGVLGSLLVFWRVLLRRPAMRGEARLLLRFCRALARLGVEYRPWEPPGTVAERAARQLPALARDIRHITDLYISVAYQEYASQSLRRQLRVEVWRFQLRALFSRRATH